MTDDVSRETPTPPAPDSARGVFAAARLDRAQRYADLLAGEGVLRGLIGPREVPRLWERHLENCALVTRLVPDSATVCDVGSGAGLPGVVWAIARPDLSVTLVEPLLRRATFLDEAVAALGLDNCEVVRARAEDLHGGRRFDVVTARAVAPLARLLEWSMPLVDTDGVLLALKGARAEQEIVEAGATLRRLGCGAPLVSTVGEGVAAATVVRVAWADPSRVG